MLFLRAGDLSRLIRPHSLLLDDFQLTKRNKVLISLKQNKLPNIYELLSHLKFKFNIGKYMAIQNNDVCLFEKLWSLRKNIFDF
jgi:hypothetical protein